MKESLVNQVIQWLRKPSIGLRSTHIDCFSTLKIHTEDETEPFMFHATPDFYNKTRFDWCNIKWENSDIGSCDLYPGRLLMFIDPTNLSFKNTVGIEKLGKYWAVTNSCGPVEQFSAKKRKRSTSSYTYSNQSNVVIQRLQIEDEIRLVDCDAIDGETFVLCDTRVHSSEKDNYVLKLNNLNKWGRLFMSPEIWGRKNRKRRTD